MQVTFYRDKVRTMLQTFDGILVRAFCNGYEDDVLDEELEICKELTNKIIKSICNGCSQQNVANILETGETSYEHFYINFETIVAQNIAKKIWEYKDKILKYIKLAKQEELDYPVEAVKRIKQIENELNNDLENADQ